MQNKQTNIKKYYLLPIFFCWFLASNFSQVDASISTVALKQADSLYSTKEYQSAFGKYVIAANTYKELEDWDNYIHIFYKKFIGSINHSPVQDTALTLLLEVEKNLSTRQVSDTTLAKLFLTTADIYENKYKFPEDSIYLFKAQSTLGEKNNKTKIFVYNQLQIGRFYYLQKQYTTAKSYFEKALLLGQQLNFPTLSWQANFMIANCLNGLNNLKESMVIYKKLMDSAGSRENFAGINNYIGQAYFKLGDFHTALNHFIKAKDIYLALNHPDINAIYTSLGRVYTTLGDADKKLFYYEKSAIGQIERYGENHPKLIRVYRNLAAAYKIHNIEEAIKYSKKALTIAVKTYGEHSYQAGYSQTQLGIITIDEPEYYDFALEQLQQSKQILQAIKSDKKYDGLWRNEWAFGILADHQDKPALAKQHFLQSNEYALIANPGFMADNYYFIARAEIELAEYEEALVNYLKVLTIFFPSIQEESDLEKLDLDNIQDKPALLELIARLAQTNLFLFQETKDKQYLSTASQELILVDSICRQVKLEYTGSTTRLYIAEAEKIINELLLKSQLIKNEEAPQSLHYQNAFVAAERNKHSIIREQLNINNVKTIATIPDSLLEKERQLKLDLAYYHKERFVQKGVDIQQAKKNVNTKIDEIKTVYIQLKETFKNHYPEYYQLQYDLNHITPDEIQRHLLNPNQALIEYFVGEKEIYIFVITTEHQKVLSVPYHDNFLKEQVESLTKSSYSYFFDGNQNEEAYISQSTKLTNAAYELHQLLIAPILKKQDLPKELIIIPSQILGYIPFELLLKERPSNPIHFATHPYLLRDYQISYNYSATLLKEMKDKEVSPSAGLLAIAPHFKKQESKDNTIASIRNELGPLQYNREEIQAVQEIINGQLLTDQDATEAAFLKQASKHQIIHLATHGKANDKMGDYSFLAFTEIADSVENEFVYTRDLYNLTLNADMVVLSACETGIGKLWAGEGIVSLARAFSFAGAKSVINTLWSINDQTTTELMTTFYEHLKLGKSKDAALRQAKLDFLAAHPHEVAHPFYWAPFIAIGDMDAISFKETSWLWLGLIVTLFLGVMGSVYLFRSLK